MRDRHSIAELVAALLSVPAAIFLVFGFFPGLLAVVIGGILLVSK